MASVSELRDRVLASEGYEVIERLRSFDIAYSAFKYHHNSLIDSIESENPSQYELSRKLIAYTGTITPLRDQANSLKASMGESFEEEYVQRLCTDFDLQLSDFFIEIRHYVQHTHIPYLITPDDVPPRHFGRSVPAGVYIHIGELNERGRDFKKDKAVEFIENRDSEIVELKPLLQDYFESTLSFNRWVANTYRDENEEKLEEAEELINRMVRVAKQR